MPTNYTFVSGDHGVHTFTSGVTLSTSGGQTITATDSVTSSIKGNTAVDVTNVAEFAITAPATVAADTPFAVTVTAETSGGSSVATNYLGTVHFSLSDTAAGAVAPFDYTFTTSDQGVHVFTGGLTLAVAGTSTITVSDSTVSGVTGSTTVSVNPTLASQLSLTAPSTATAGTPFSITVEALDPHGSVATSYRGTVHFSSTDDGVGVSLPSDYTFVSGDNGVHVFSSDVTLVSAAYQMVTAEDTSYNAFVGSAIVSVSASSGTHLVLTGQRTISPDVPLTLTATALDTNGNIATGYTGTIHFTTFDSSSVNAEQTITFTGSPTGGTFALIFAGNTSFRHHLHHHVDRAGIQHSKRTQCVDRDRHGQLGRHCHQPDQCQRDFPGQLGKQSSADNDGRKLSQRRHHPSAFRRHRPSWG